MKSLIKSILRKLGILRWVRKLIYEKQYHGLIKQFSGQSEYAVDFGGIKSKFSLVDPFSATFFASYFKKGVYEEEGLKTLLEEASKDAVVFDVGANIGYFTCFAGYHSGRGSVHAFEMGRENFNILQRNITLNRLGNVFAKCCAVSDFSGKVLVEDSAVGNAVLKIMNKNERKDDLISVESISLNDYCKAANVKPDFVKIDVEGAEMKVLNGMTDILKQPAKILVEIHDKDLKYYHSSKEEVLNFIKSFGFEIKLIGNDAKKNLLVFAKK